MRRLFYLLVLPVLASCAVIPDEWIGGSKYETDMSDLSRSYTIFPPPPETVFTGSETVYQRNYVLNERMTARVGETVLRVQAFRKENFVSHKMRLDKAVNVKTAFEKFTMPAGEYPVYGSFEMNNETFFVLPERKHVYILVNMSGELQPRFLYAMKNSDKVSVFPDKAEFTPANVRMKRAAFSNQAKIPFMDFEVVYDGIKNNQIVLFHKDSVPGTDGAAGSFETYVYPADATMISVDGALLRIIRADKEKLEFIVIKNP